MKLFYLALSSCFVLMRCSNKTSNERLHRRLTTRIYPASSAALANPERGWIWPYNPECCVTDIPHAPLVASDLQALRTGPDRITLIRDMVQLGMFMTTDISPQMLDEIEADWNEARVAGVKVIV
jgi:hypothetical protein